MDWNGSLVQANVKLSLSAHSQSARLPPNTPPPICSSDWRVTLKLNHRHLIPGTPPHPSCFSPAPSCPLPPPLLPDMTLDDVRDFERQMHEKTNIKVVNCHEQPEHSTTTTSSLDDIEIHEPASVCALLSFFPHAIASFFTSCPLVSSRNKTATFAEKPAMQTNFLSNRFRF